MESSENTEQKQSFICRVPPPELKEINYYSRLLYETGLKTVQKL